MNRRDFLTKSGKAIVFSTLIGEAGLINVGCQSEGGQKKAIEKLNFEVADDPQLPKVVMAYNEDHVIALRSALDAIGGIKRFVKEGEKVLLKPNAAFARVPEQAVNTNPVIVGEMTRQCRLAGASDVIVTDHSGSRNPERVFSLSGIKNAVKKSGGRVVFVGRGDFIEDDLKGRFISTWPVLKYVFEVDRIINMPIAKHHTVTYGTASMKNFFGAIGGNRPALHEQLDQAIVDLAAYFRPTLTVIDATHVLMQHGPEGGSFSDVTKLNSVICATDQVAADSRACEFLGMSGKEINYILLASQQGLGNINYREVGYVEII
jgi:uncharacterized protein (DUF362 family)